MSDYQKYIVKFMLIFLYGCVTNESVEFIKSGDAGLSCYDLHSQISKLKEIYDENDEKSGVSSENILMGLIYWPGIFYNISQSSINRNSLNERIIHLESIYKLKCQ